jgi:hypothetical protein
MTYKEKVSPIRAFIAAPANENLAALKELLIKRGIHIFTAYDLPPASGSLAMNIEQAILQADIVIAVLPQHESPNVFFELGMAKVLRKPSLILVSPKYGQLPFDLADTLYFRADSQNSEVIGFALDQCLSQVKKRIVRTPKPRKEGRPLGDKADNFLARINTGLMDSRGRGTEDLVAEVLQAAGVRVMTQSQRPDQGADIAVWSDALQSVTGNPILIEIKSGVPGRAQLLQTIKRVEQYRLRSGARIALLVINGILKVTPNVPFTAGVLVITLGDLITSLRTRTFDQMVRELRNQSVHGGRR